MDSRRSDLQIDTGPYKGPYTVLYGPYMVVGPSDEGAYQQHEDAPNLAPLATLEGALPKQLLLIGLTGLSFGSGLGL